MSKPIRCTTHFHACDCREYEFEMVKKENQEMREALIHVCQGLGFYTDFRTGEGKKISEIISKFNLSESPNSSKEGV